MFVSPSFDRFARYATLLSAAAALGLAGLSAARADCGQDMSALMTKRTNAIAVINANTRTHSGKLDPVSACPQLRNLAAVESEVVAYMTKNKDWCSLPDDLISKMSESRARTAGVAVKACDFVVKLKKMQEQQAQAGAQQQQQAVKLPTGPL